MMRCSNVAVLLGEYADEQADERGRRIVERHLALCDRCRTDLTLLRQISRQLQRIALLPLGVAGRLPRYQREFESRLLAQESARRRRPWLALLVVVFLLVEAGSVLLLTLLVHAS